MDISKNFLKCFAFTSLIIELAHGKEMTGYDVMVHLKRFGFRVSPGTVYNHIDMLFNERLVESRSVKRVRSTKTVYKLTEKGIRFYEDFKENWSEPIGYLYKNMTA